MMPFLMKKTMATDIRGIKHFNRNKKGGLLFWGNNQLQGGNTIHYTTTWLTHANTC